MKWTKQQIETLIEFYPTKGKQWCIEHLGLTEGQIRQKASRLKLTARGISEAWHKKQIEHSKILTGRKRPDQSIVCKNNWKTGKFKFYTDERKQNTSHRMKNQWKVLQHPKGFKNHQHSDNSKKIISIKSIQAWNNYSEMKKNDMKIKSLKTKEKNQTLYTNRVNTTWKSGWREIGEKRKFYRSKWEANYARYLEWLKRNNQIIDWQHECKTFWFEGIKRGCVSYLPDFLVIDLDNSESYHEVKGWMDDRSKTKLKRMAKYYPEVKLLVIASKEYKELTKKMSAIIPDWEG